MEKTPHGMDTVLRHMTDKLEADRELLVGRLLCDIRSFDEHKRLLSELHANVRALDALGTMFGMAPPELNQIIKRTSSPLGLIQRTSKTPPYQHEEIEEGMAKVLASIAPKV